jgi:hypothetical protein
MKKLWEKFVAWFLAKPWAWVKKNWFLIVNYIVILLAYNNVWSKEGVLFAEVLLGLWIFASVAYGGYLLFVKPKKKVCTCKCKKCGTECTCDC